MLTIPVWENAHVFLFYFILKGLDISDDNDLLECIFNLPLPNIGENNAIDLKLIQPQLLATKTAKYPKQYFNKVIDGNKIVCHALPNEGNLTLWKIALTKEMVIMWFNSMLA